MTITFNRIYNSGKVIYSNEVYEHRHDDGFLLRYDSNFIEFKKMPTDKQLLEAIQYLTKFHQQRGQQFVKLKFPENEVPSKELLNKLKDYALGFLELYTLDPKSFKGIGTEVEVQFVEEAQLEDFLKLQYEEDLHYGEHYAKQKQDFLLREREKKGHHQIIAYKNNMPVGSVLLIETEDTLEIDNFFVIATKQGLGIGSAIQRFVMSYAKDKTIILVADGEDDVRNMYKKQGYIYAGFQYEAFRKLSK